MDIEKKNFVTADNSGGYYVCECENCGYVFSSENANGGAPLADSGDYDDIRCPECDYVSPSDCENPNLVWNVQQAKINLLEAENARLQSIIDAQQSPAVAVPDDIQWLIDRVRKWGIENTGNEPSVSCFHRALDELVDALTKSQRVNENDAREIIEHFIGKYSITGYQNYIEGWIAHHCAPLLTKLNEANHAR